MFRQVPQLAVLVAAAAAGHRQLGLLPRRAAAVDGAVRRVLLLGLLVMVTVPRLLRPLRPARPRVPALRGALLGAPAGSRG